MFVKPIAKAEGNVGHDTSPDVTLMTDTKLRKAIGSRIKELRKQRAWTQKDLANRVGIRHELLNKYEMGLHSPPVEKLIALAEALQTTSDYLLIGSAPDDTALTNTRLLDRLLAIQELPVEDQEVVVNVLDGMIVKHRIQSATAPVDRPRKAAAGRR